MKFNFIEVGTSDFRTLAHTVNGNGISIEPIKAYFDRLPEREGLVKINCAISDKEGTVEAFYCDPEVITRWALPTWLRGCNSIQIEHPTVRKWCTENKFDFDLLVKKEEVPVRTLQSIFEEYMITELDFLKVDTEGHDYVIMKSILSDWVKRAQNSWNDKLLLEGDDQIEKQVPIIDRIQYESNSLMTWEQKRELISMAEELGYTWKTKFERGNEDTILNLVR